MQIYGLWSPCRILAVYAADLVSLALIADDGTTTRDDLMLQLLSVEGRTIQRACDPPLNALRLYAPDADGGRSNKMEPGPCPEGRRFVQSLVRRYRRHYVHVPVTGTGWLESLSPGARVAGSLYLYGPGPVLHPSVNECVSVSDEVLQAGHGTIRGRRVA